MAGKKKKKFISIDKKNNTKVYKGEEISTHKKNDVKKEKKKKKHPKLRIAIKIIIVLISLTILIGGGIVAGYIFGAFGDEFKITKEQLLVKNSNSVAVDKDGNIIAKLSGEENRKVITIDDMSEYLPKAFVAIEDERFEEHQGVDFKRTVSATIKYALSKVGIGSASYGGSTITQQLVKLVTQEDERTWQRKLKEISRALEVEKLISKDQILELYLNIIYLGGNSYGVEVASNYYFNKPAKDLTIAEAAFLAGVNHSPNGYEPFKTDGTDEEKQKMVEKIKDRTKVVLTKMKELGKINEEQCNNAKTEVENGMAFNKGSITQVKYSYHTDAAITQVLNQLQEENAWSKEMAKMELYGGNYTIYTTQDSGIQAILEEEVKKDKYIVKSRENKDEDGNWVNSQIAMTIIDQLTGNVVASVGGSGEKTDSFGLNRATQSTRQTGSSMKPLAVIAPGVENGIITAGSVYDDVPTSWGSYRPKNYYGGYKGLSTVRYAIEISQNIVEVKMLSIIGVDKSIEFLKQMGITSLVDDKEGLGMALGGLTNGISPLEMAGAYATIANNGVYITPTFYSKVVNTNGETVLEPKQESRRVMSEASSYVVKSILKQPVIGSGGTATACAISGMDVCAKTGTTDDDNDRWLCGFTPYYTGACWFGYDEPEEVRYSGNPALKVWDAVMTEVHSNLEKKRFVKPESGVTYATICKDSGQLAGEFCNEDPRGDRVYSEIYVVGTVPSKTCTCHVKTRICNSTGKVANEFCNDYTEKVFITREDYDTNRAWEKAKDAEFMLPEETCNLHVAPTPIPEPEPEPEQEPEKPTNNTITNNTTTNTTENEIINTIGNNTIANNTVSNNTL